MGTAHILTTQACMSKSQMKTMLITFFDTKGSSNRLKFVPMYIDLFKICCCITIWPL